MPGYGSDTVTGRGGVPRRAAGMACGQQPRARAGRRRGRVRVPSRLAAQAARGRMGRRLLAQGIRRSRRHADRAGDLQRGGGPRADAVGGQRARAGDGRPDRDRARDGGAAKALPAADPVRRRDLVPGVLRARRRLGPGIAEDARGAPRRRMGRDRAEGVDDVRAPRQVVHAGGEDRPRRAQAQGADLLPHGHGAGRRSGPSAAPDHRRIGVQRAVHRGGADPAREHRRRARARGGRWRSPRSCTSARRWRSASR